jgi:hypothetical protein
MAYFFGQTYIQPSKTSFGGLSHPKPWNLRSTFFLNGVRVMIAMHSVWPISHTCVNRTLSFLTQGGSPLANSLQIVYQRVSLEI